MVAVSLKKKAMAMQAMDDASMRADIILLTGGLGPTKDDITKHTLAEYFGVGFVFHESTFQHVKSLFDARNYKAFFRSSGFEYYDKRACG